MIPEQLTPAQKLKIWKENNKDKVKEYSKRYHEKHRERLLENGREYYLKNRISIRKKTFTNKCSCGKAIHYSAKRCRSCDMKGELNTMFGKRESDAPAWKGGVSFGDYGFEFRRSKKLEIKKRDGFLCRVCKKRKAYGVHHKDFNKKNNNDDNLISTCNPCHASLHAKERRRNKNGTFAK